MGSGGDDLHGRWPIVQGAERAGVVGPGNERIGRYRVDQVLPVRLDAVHHRRRQGVVQFPTGVLAGLAPGQHLGEKRVVERRDGGPLAQPGVHPHAFAAGQFDHRDRARRRSEVVVRVFRAEPRFHRAAPGYQRGGQAIERSQFAGRQLDHPAHQVDAVDQLGDTVLDLQPGIDLQEGGGLARRVVEELDGTCASVVYGDEQCLGIGVEPRSQVFRQVRCGALLDHLLVPTLERTVPVAEDGDVAFAVAECLHLHVPRLVQTAFHEQAGISERRLREALDGAEALFEFRRIRASLRTDTAATRRALQHHRIADRLGELPGLVDVA